MAINKIKIQQIDADISGLIYNASTGFFVQTGVFFDFSGKSLTKQEFSGQKLVYSTGNQGVSGVKNFFSRPLLSGQGLSLQSEGVQITGNQDIFGRKNFRSGSYFYDENIFSNATGVFNQSSLRFTGSNFLFDSASLQNLSNSVNSSFILKTGNQDISGLKTFLGGANLQSGEFILSGYSILNSQSLVNGSTVFSGGAISTNILSVRSSSNSSVTIIDSFSSSAGLGALRTYDGSGNVGINLSNRASAHESRLIFPTGKNAIFEISLTGSAGNTNPVMDSGDFRSYYSFFFGNLRLFNIGLSGCGSSSFESNKFIKSGDNVYASFFPSLGNLGSNIGTGSGDLQNRNISLGLPNYRWSDIYSYNSPIIVSDKNEKSFIGPIPDEWLDAWQNINYSRYKFNSAVSLKGSGEARWHFGMIAQDIYEEFQKSGINPLKFGLISKNSWETEYDENGDLVRLSGEMFSIRPDECQFMEMALMRREIERLKSGFY